MMKFLQITVLFFLPATLLQGAEPLWNGYGRQSEAPKTTGFPTTPDADPTATRFYLLRTGFLMEGTATTEGNHYILKTDFGTIHVPTSNVEYVGADKLDIYRYKKSFVDGGNCNDLMKFAEWCLSLGLKQEGIEEYERALKVAPNATLREVIRERLEAAYRHGELPAETLNLPLSGSAAPSKHRRESEINRWAAEVPKSVVDGYVKKVQPILQAGCGAADCHGTNSPNKLKLGKPRQMLGATTYGNLRAVLPWINLDYPTESPLLTAMISYHGGVRASYTVESRQYDNVLQWIQLAAKELPIEYHQSYREKEEEKSVSEVVRSDESSRFESEKGRLLPVTFHERASQEPLVREPAKRDVKEPFSNTGTEPNRLGDGTEKWSIDQLDPDVFNARYHGTKMQ